MSKNFWAIIIGSVIICIGVINAGNNVANHITSFPNTLNVAADDGRATDTYLSESEAAAFFKLSDTDFQKLLQTGVLDKTYTVLQGLRVYSENALADYIRGNIGNSVPKK